MNPPCLVLISYHFYPSNEIGARRATALARFLAERGVRVLVISAFGDADVRPGSEILPGVIAVPVKRPRRLIIDAMMGLRRVPNSPGSERNGLNTSSVQGGVRLLSWSKQSMHRAFFRAAYFIDEFKKWAWRASAAAVTVGRAQQARAVLSSAPPNSVLLAGARAARKLHIPHIADLRDPWTAAEISDRARKIEYRMQRPLEAWVMRNSAAITSATATVANYLTSRYPAIRENIHVVRNGFDGEPRPSRTETGGQLSILFAGELYLGRNPFPLLMCLERLLTRSEIDATRINMTLMGRVSTYAGESLDHWLRGKRSEQVVKILPQSTQEVVARAVDSATVLLNLSQEQPMSIPAKTYEQLAAGREILLICENESETAQLVANIKGVHQVDARNPEALEETLLDLYRRHVNSGFMCPPSTEEVLKFSRALANEQFWSIFDSVAQVSEHLPQMRHR